MYHSAPILSEVDNLAAQIRAASPEERVKLQPGFGRALQQMEQSGKTVPARLRNLHEQLLEEAIEDQFDNLPI